MDQATRQAWANELRSGKYTQAEGDLKVFNKNKYDENGLGPLKGHCCLGVFCELEGWKNEYDGYANLPPSLKLKYNTTSNLVYGDWINKLPETIKAKVQTLYELNQAKLKDWFSLEVLNDGLAREDFYDEGEDFVLPDIKCTFNEIAEIILVAEFVPYISEEE